MSIAVIGAGPAGALASVLLARGERAVTLFEEKSFPRDKVCGECLSALGLAVLRKHDLASVIESVGRPIMRTLIIGHSSTLDLPLPSPMLGVSRAVLDAHLLESARSAGASIRQPARVEHLDPTATGVRLRVRNLTTNAVTLESFNTVLLADGRAALLGDKPKPTGTIGIKTHFQGVTAAADAVTLYHTDGSYGGLAPIEGGRWNAAFAVPAALLKAHAGDVAAAFDALRHTNRRLDADLASADRCAPWLAAPLPRYAVRDDWPSHVVPIGNAAAAIEPVGGEGMGLALRSAELAVQTVLQDQLHLLSSQYKDLWRTRRLGCRLGGIALAGPVADVAGDWLSAHPAVSRVALALIGK